MQNSRLPKPFSAIFARSVSIEYDLYCLQVRAVAQFGSALRSGRRGPGFKSRQPDGL